MSLAISQSRSSGFNYNVPVLDVEPLGSIVDPDLDMQMISTSASFLQEM
jgi:hypothetical protein